MQYMVYTHARVSGFYSNMETSRRIRAGTRNYIMCIAAAVSQEDLLVYITRKVTQPENGMILVLASKLT